MGVAAIAREGTDITLVSAMKSVDDCLEAAEALAGEGISAEVSTCRRSARSTATTMLRSLAKTNRIAVVEEGPRTGGWAGEVLAVVTEHGLGDIDDALRITTADTPIPYSPPLEDAFLPGAQRIADSVRGATLNDDNDKGETCLRKR